MQITCPFCGYRTEREVAAGQEIACPWCSHPFQPLPAPAEPEPPVVAPSPPPEAPASPPEPRTWKTVCKEWLRVVPALVVCLGGFFNYTRAWYVGNGASAIGLLGCHFLSLLLLILSWGSVVIVFRAEVSKEQLARNKATTFDAVILAFFIGSGCMGCYPLWPAVLVLLATTFLYAMVFARTEDRLPRRAALRGGVALLLFALTWYFCASTSRQAYRGLGERIEARGGADRLRAWAEELIDECKQGKRQPRFDRTELPDWIDELLGPFQGVKGVFVYGADQDDPSVVLYTGGSAYHFQITVHPKRRERNPPLWWFGSESEWQPGIYLGIGGK
jgi:hypothetical protein